jgi:aryl-alcohol dehydrogenase-like predicted oxidoreductase
VQIRALGITALPVSPLGLGLAALGRPAYITLGREADLGIDRSVEAMERRCHDMLDAAYAAGVRYFDTARSYGFAERFLASWLDARRLERVTIGSKWGYTYTGAWRMDAPTHEQKDHSIATLRRQLAESRACLGERLHLYQIHSATLESGVLDDRGVLAELVRLRAGGLCIGFSVSGPRQADVIRRALDVSIDGANPFQTVQATWNLLETSAAAALAEAHRYGWGVIIKEVHANGRLTDPHADEHTRPLVERARALGTTLDALAIAAALSRPWIDVVLSGAVTSEHLDSHLSALALTNHQLDLPAAAEPPTEYWQHRSTLVWH